MVNADASAQSVGTVKLEGLTMDTKDEVEEEADHEVTSSETFVLLTCTGRVSLPQRPC